VFLVALLGAVDVLLALEKRWANPTLLVRPRTIKDLPDAQTNAQ
jgi:hypothetical protein